MKAREIANSQYEALCKQLGHLYNNKEKIEHDIQLIKNKIEAINSAVEIINEVERKEAQEQVLADMAAGAAERTKDEGTVG